MGPEGEGLQLQAQGDPGEASPSCAWGLGLPPLSLTLARWEEEPPQLAADLGSCPGIQESEL